eukprot:15966-Heterococcus_DN1.PRE.2
MADVAESNASDAVPAAQPDKQPLPWRVFGLPQPLDLQVTRKRLAMQDPEHLPDYAQLACNTAAAMVGGTWLGYLRGRQLSVTLPVHQRGPLAMRSAIGVGLKCASFVALYTGTVVVCRAATGKFHPAHPAYGAALACAALSARSGVLAVGNGIAVGTALGLSVGVVQQLLWSKLREAQEAEARAAALVAAQEENEEKAVDDMLEMLDYSLRSWPEPQQEQQKQQQQFKHGEKQQR